MGSCASLDARDILLVEPQPGISLKHQVLLQIWACIPQGEKHEQTHSKGGL